MWTNQFSHLLKWFYWILWESRERIVLEQTSGPEADVPLGGAGDAFEAEHIHELECIENIPLSINSHTTERRQLSYFGGVWFGRRWEGEKAWKRMGKSGHMTAPTSAVFSNFHPPPIICIIPLEWPPLLWPLLIPSAQTPLPPWPLPCNHRTRVPAIAD